MAILDFSFLAVVGGMVSTTFRSISRVFFKCWFQITYACRLRLWAGSYWFSVMSFSKWPPGGHIGFICFWTLNFSSAMTHVWISDPSFSHILPMCMGETCVEAYQCLVMSLSKWPPGSHIGFFGFRTKFSFECPVQISLSRDLYLYVQC